MSKCGWAHGCWLLVACACESAEPRASLSKPSGTSSAARSNANIPAGSSGGAKIPAVGSGTPLVSAAISGAPKPSTCTGGAKILDVQGDLHGLWTLAETLSSGKRAAQQTLVSVAFDTAIEARDVVGRFVPAQTNGRCGAAVTAKVSSSLHPLSVWGSINRGPHPFVAADALPNLRALSTLLGNREANGSSTLSSDTLILSGQNERLNTFELTTVELAQAKAVQISVPKGAAAIVQIDGTSVEFSNKVLSLSGVRAPNLLWNLPTTRALSIDAIHIPGSILAPQATVHLEGGSIAGTLVARRLMSQPGATIRYAPSNAGLLFDPALTPSALALSPGQPLKRSCQYEFQLTAAAGGFCLQNPLAIAFFVNDYPNTPATRELTDVGHDPSLTSLRLFRVGPGINSTVDEAFFRYQREIGISDLDLVSSGKGGPSLSRQNQFVTSYEQYTQGYPVRGYGYFVSTENGFLRSGNGKVAPNLPNFPPPRLTSAAALQNALKAIGVRQWPWQRDPSNHRAPVGSLMIAQLADGFALVWSFDFASAGVGDPREVVVDAATGAIVVIEPGIVHAAPSVAR